MRIIVLGSLLSLIACGRGGFERAESMSLTCAPGFSAVGLTCLDIDECSDGSAECDANALCSNAPGGFSCTCASGFVGDGVACSDIDECASSLCAPEATCTNSAGSFACTCNPPSVGDGFACTSCGNALCEEGEGCLSCAVDCGACSDTCAGGACAVTSIRIIDPVTLLDRGPLRDGQLIDDASFPAGFALLAIAEPSVIGSIVFDVSGMRVVESDAPYGILNNTAAGGQLTSIARLRAGQGRHTVTVTPYGSAGGSGATGTPLSRTFDVTGTLRAQVGRIPTTADEGTHDAEEPAAGDVRVFGLDINLGVATTAFVFRRLVLDPMQPVADAYLELVATESDGVCPIRFAISSDASGIDPNPAPFSLSTRPKLSGRIDWDPPPFVPGTTYRTPNLAELLAERFASGPFDSNLFFLTEKASADDCVRRVVSSDASNENMATLVIAY